MIDTAQIERAAHAPRVHPAGPPRLRIAVGCDSARVTGLGLWAVPAHDGTGALGLLGLCTVNIEAAGWREADSIGLLDALLEDAAGGREIEWAAAVEDVYQPQPEVDGRFLGRPPTAARKHWIRVIDLLARERAARAGVRFTAPKPYAVKARTWRKTLGVNAYVTRFGGDTKAAALAYVRDVLRLDIDEHNAAEGVLIAHYLSRVAQLPTVPKLGRPILFVR